jgi:glycosyltransferase involved in cell wall biosynthesis
MKLLQANKAYYPHIGGIETVVQQIAEGMAARNWESGVVACSDDRRTRRETRHGVTVTYAGIVARVASLPISPSYARFLLGDAADVLHVHEPSLLAAAAYIARKPLARRRFRRLVVSWHSDIVRQRALEPMYRPLLNALLREAAAIVVATPKHISSSSFLQPVRHKCVVAPYGVDLNRFTQTAGLAERAAALRRQYGGRIILATGRLVYYKGMQYLVEAMRDVPRAHLVIVGRGPLLAQLEQIAAAGRGNVSFVPHLPEEDLVAINHAQEIFVLPSVEPSEAFGIVQLEAMACSKPVITTDLPTGVNYVNQDGVTGLVVPRRDRHALAAAINRLLDDPAYARGLGEAARRRLHSEFTLETMLNRLARLYEDLLRAQRPARDAEFANART